MPCFGSTRNERIYLLKNVSEFREKRENTKDELAIDQEIGDQKFEKTSQLAEAQRQDVLRRTVCCGGLDRRRI